jgi:hypothetical protein
MPFLSECKWQRIRNKIESGFSLVVRYGPRGGQWIRNQLGQWIYPVPNLLYSRINNKAQKKMKFKLLDVFFAKLLRRISWLATPS